ncbi:uncharacterized protein LOC108837832 isoform X2 [Raphanus sativus]|uniref:Uncharacterized protein LOC108837832 isoform X2 n=1 Tax=Raphanus sativus TaxID=3726 RepID=A0A9W3CXS3_RAPSA|nr:uncharacterized protein LOC108837832 isoform X2 [Raphanus sativus]
MHKLAKKEVEDPIKLSGKLTRALYRKLQHSPNTWGAYTTSRVGSARFPERYKASFPDSVTVAGLEVFEGDSVFEVSSGASTSEKSQSQKMPIQPSFRSIGRSTKAASSSRGSDKNQGGSFLDSVKEVLDEGGSAPAKDVGPSEPRVQEVGLPSEVPMTEADPQLARDPSEFEPPRSKRSRTEQVDRPSSSSSSSSRGGTIGWNFAHSKPGSVLDDSWGLATLMRHMKRTGCALPSIANLSNKEEYVDIAHHMGQLAGAINRAQFKFEEAVHNAPSAEELAQVTDLVKATKAELNQTRALISELQAEVKRLGSKCDAQQGTIESQLIDLQVKNRKIGDLDASQKIAEYQVKELIASSQSIQKNKEAEVKLAVRRGKREVADAYNKVLVAVKEKFSKKKDEVDLLVHAQEVQANTQLLKDMLDGEIKSAEDEYARLVAMMPEAIAAYEKAQVSDFSISKLPLPQLSESLAPIEAAPGDGDKEMEEEVPEEKDDLVDKGAEKSSDDKEV